jgi:hypothetical protein
MERAIGPTPDRSADQAEADYRHERFSRQRSLPERAETPTGGGSGREFMPATRAWPTEGRGRHRSNCRVLGSSDCSVGNAAGHDCSRVRTLFLRREPDQCRTTHQNSFAGDASHS